MSAEISPEMATQLAQHASDDPDDGPMSTGGFSDPELDALRKAEPLCVCRHPKHEKSRCGYCECGVYAPADTELAEMAEKQQKEEAEHFREVEVLCGKCGSRATVTRTKTGSGFIILGMAGMPIGTASFGISEAGLPICPNDGEGMKPIDAKPIAEAMAEAAEKLPADKIAPAQQPLFEPPPFDLHHAFAEIIRQQERVTGKRATWEELKAETKEAKEDLDNASEMLEKLIARTAEQEREAQAAARRAAARQADPTIADVPTPAEHARELTEMQAAAREQQLAGASPTQVITDDPQAESAGALADEMAAAPAAAEEILEQLEPASPRVKVIEILRKHGAADPVDLAGVIFDGGGSIADGELLEAAGIASAMIPAVIVELQAAAGEVAPPPNGAAPAEKKKRAPRKKAVI